ncbi:MAG: hypothetical protein NPIRA03_13050 [Nitrospirales bacterium]|nr:MAG: hypothetical protein NPIRA03_13050 [Nitrospirales bacterium]
MVVLARFVNVCPLAFVVGSIYEMLTTGFDAVTLIWADVRQFETSPVPEEETCGEMG